MLRTTHHHKDEWVDRVVDGLAVLDSTMHMAHIHGGAETAAFYPYPPQADLIILQVI